MTLTGSGILLAPSRCVFQSIRRFCIGSGRLTSPLLLFRESLQSELRPNDATLSRILKHAVSVPSLLSSLDAKQIGNHLVKSGLDYFPHLGTALLHVLAKRRFVTDARDVFDCMPVRDVVAWNALIDGYSKNGYDFNAIKCIVQMLREGFVPNGTTLVCLAASCGRTDLICNGEAIHGFGIKAGFDSDCQVKNALVSMYGRGGYILEAEILFHELDDRTVVSWNTMIGVYNQNEYFKEAMLTFKMMIEQSVKVNMVTIINLLCSNIDPRFSHCFLIKIGHDSQASVITTLICSYAKYGNVESSESLFGSSKQDSIVSLTAITISYAQRGDVRSILNCYSRMRRLNMELDSVSMVSFVHGIANHTDLRFGLAFHGLALKTGLNSSSLVSNGIINMYFKFGHLKSVIALFDDMDTKSLITWNSMISGFAQTGRPDIALHLFCEMRKSGHRPDTITMASLLSACSQIGYLQIGKKLHCYIFKYNLELEDFLLTSLVDMYTKCGSILQAENVFTSTKEPCLAMWNTMISGYSWYGSEEKVFTCYSKMQEQGLYPDEISFLGILAACTYGGYVTEGTRLFTIMIEQRSVEPTLQHYAFVVALLGRAALLVEAITVISRMKKKPDSAVLGALLNACCILQEVKIGEWLAKKMYLLDSTNGGLFILMSNLYAAAGRWTDVARVRDMMREGGGDGCSGVSQVEACS